jgi:hypothetical protein
MAKRLGGRVVLAMLVLAVTGCASKASDAGPNCGDTPAPAQSSPGSAANAADVTRFADEEPFGPTAVTAHDNTTVRKSPGGGGTVTTLPAGTEVTKLAAHGTDDLVCFDDPKGGLHLMGWVAPTDLQEATPPPAPAEEDGGTEPPAPHKGHHHHGHKPKHH